MNNENIENKDVIKKINELGEFCTTHFKAQLDILKFLLKSQQELTARMIDFFKGDEESHNTICQSLKLYSALSKKEIVRHEAVENKVDRAIALLKKKDK